MGSHRESNPSKSSSKREILNPNEIFSWDRTREIDIFACLSGPLRGQINHAKMSISHPVPGGTPAGELTGREICKITLTEYKEIPSRKASKEKFS